MKLSCDDPPRHLQQEYDLVPPHPGLDLEEECLIDYKYK